MSTVTRMKGMGYQRQRGAVAIMFGLTLAVLIGFAGLAIDLGRFFVIKTELQNGMDACALSAASQLRPGLNNPNALTRAVAYGRVFTTGGNAIKNKANFQSVAINIQSDQITFSQTLGGTYQSIAGGANYDTAAYVKCTYPMTDLPIFFMKVLNPLLTTQTVSAMAAATLAPSSSSCAIPAGICEKNPGTNFGFTVGEWIMYGDKLGLGNFGWLDFTMTGGGTNDIRDLLAGSGFCTAKLGDEVSEYGKSVGAYQGWNSRFGLYKGTIRLEDAPPDITGYAYYGNPASSNSEGAVTWSPSSNAYSGASTVIGSKNYVTAANSYLPYQFSPDLTTDQHRTLGRNKRVTVAPIVGSCGDKKLKIKGWACVLMLNPVLNSAKDTAYLEFLGLSTTPGSPCTTNGEAGTYGPLVPQLVQ